MDTVDPGYPVKGVGDLDGDGKADIVWHGAAGDVWVWLMNGTTRLSQTYVGTVPDANYQIQQVADFDGNGKADLLWWNAAQGDVWIWPMNGAACCRRLRRGGAGHELPHRGGGGLRRRQEGRHPVADHAQPATCGCG